MTLNEALKSDFVPSCDRWGYAHSTYSHTSKLTKKGTYRQTSWNSDSKHKRIIHFKDPECKIIHNIHGPAMIDYVLTDTIEKPDKPKTSYWCICNRWYCVNGKEVSKEDFLRFEKPEDKIVAADFESLF